MNSKELFALFLRVVGILAMMYMVRHILQNGPAFSVSTYLVIKWAVSVLIGLYLIRGAPLVVGFAFPEKSVK
jgi:hypothetical protein